MISLITAFLGSLGFALMFNIRKRLILPASIGGFLSWGIYLLCQYAGTGIFSASLAASAFAAVFAEVLARIFKTPSTVFYIPAVIPLVPGSSLYYTMNAAAFRNKTEFMNYGFETILYVLGIACGIFFVSGTVYIVTGQFKKK